MKKIVIAIAVATITAMLILITTRLFGLWPDWMIHLELIVKAGL